MAQELELRDAHEVGRVTLDLGMKGSKKKDDAKIAASLSGVDRVGKCVFVGADEGAGIERLRKTGKREFGGRDTFPLWQLFPGDLPVPEAKEDTEADVESIAHADGWLWLVTSHALTRAKIEEGLAGFAEIRAHPRRYVLGRVPLREADGECPEPVVEQGGRRAQCVPVSDPALRRGGSMLTGAIARDPYLRQSLALPAKEGGLDIEGMAAGGDRVVLGLRGPVLRGMAVLLDLTWPGGEGEDAFAGWRKGLPYRRLFVDLHGLGVRDLCRCRRDLMILAGPPMVDPAPFRIFRIAGFFDDPQPAEIAEAEYLCDIPWSGANPEGLTLYKKDPDTFLVLLDGASDGARAQGVLFTL